jgi:hypothetical protein
MKLCRACQLTDKICNVQLYNVMIRLSTTSQCLLLNGFFLRVSVE